MFFIDIARSGEYKYEKNQAFFPLFPFVLRFFNKFLSLLFGEVVKEEVT